MDEHDDFRRIMSERAGLLNDLRFIGGVDLDLAKGAGFDASQTVVRKAGQGGGSGTYIGSYYAYDSEDRRRH